MLNLTNLYKKHAPLLISVAALWIIIIIELALSVRLNQGHIIYALDDPYIHMAIARNIAQHGVWGVTPYGFSSASSSPLYILILSSAYFLFGVNEITPLILNVAFATLSLYVIYYFLKRHVTPSYTLATLLFIILVSPLPAIIFTGMEHTLQILLAIPLVYLSASIAMKDNVSKKEYIIISALALLSAALRYEGLLLLFAVSALFVFNKHWKLATLTMMCGVLPIVLYGIFSLHQGSYFLPNSIIAKSLLAQSHTSTFSSFGLINFISSAMVKFIIAYSLAYAIIATIILLVGQYTVRDVTSHKLKIQKKISIKIPLLTIFISTSILHLLFAEVGWFYRYEAYLLCIGIFVIAITLCDLKIPTRMNVKALMTVLVLLIITMPVTEHSVQALRIIPQATNNIYEQQYQMGLFIERYYNNDNIAMNDIGVACYLNNIHILDLIGLASVDVTRLLRSSNYNEAAIKKLAVDDNITLGICYDAQNIPSEWVKVGQWTIPHNVICFNSTVSFYAINKKDAMKLQKNLIDFSQELPKDITQNYTEAIQ